MASLQGIQSRPMPIQAGVLALQGDFAAHARMLNQLGAEVREVRGPDDLAGLQCLCLPGGESTTMSLLLHTTGLREPLRTLLAPADAGGGGLPVLATCAGVILLARQLSGDTGTRKVDTLGLLDATVDRNAYGRQVESFEAEVEVEWGILCRDRREPVPCRDAREGVRNDAELETDSLTAVPTADDLTVVPTCLHAIFIRAPRITSVGPSAQVAGRLGDEPVLLRQGNILAATFHPEIAGDPRLHAALLEISEPNREERVVG
jgi:5'-phosphate synthase pdxT subunit